MISGGHGNTYSLGGEEFSVEKSRRDVLKLGGAGISAGIAGCSSLRPSEGESDAAPPDNGSQRESPANAGGAGGDFPTDVFERAESTAKAARAAVVTLSGERGGGGTGWVIDADRGRIVTNSHVVAESASLSVETFGGETGDAARVGYYEDLIPDVALVETDPDGLEELPLGDESDLERGDPLLTVGHPGSVGEWIMSIGRHESYEPGIDWLLSTVPTSQGNSGGPLLTVDGDVVGVVSGSTSGSNEDYSKSETLYTELPSSEELTTSVPAATLVEPVDGWT